MSPKQRKSLYLLKEFKGQFLFWTGARLTGSILALAPVYIFGLIVDFFTTYNGGPLTQFYTYLGMTVLVCLVDTVLRLTSKFYLNGVGLKVERHARLFGFDKLMDFSLAWHEKEVTGKKTTRINSGAGALKEGIGFLSQDGIESFVNIFAVAVLFSILNPKYLAVVFVYASLYLGVETYFNRILANYTNQSKKAQEKAAGFVIESSSNILTAKTLGMQKALMDKNRLLADEIFNIRTQSRRIGNLKWKVNQSISVIGSTIFILLLGLDVSAGALTVGAIVIYAGFFT